MSLLDDMAVASNHRNGFDAIIQSLHSVTDFDDNLMKRYQAWQYRIATLKFINGIISSGANVVQRDSIRQLLASSNFESTIGLIASEEDVPEAFLKQVEAFGNDKEFDYVENQALNRSRVLGLGDPASRIKELLELGTKTNTRTDMECFIAGMLSNLNGLLGSSLNQKNRPDGRYCASQLDAVLKQQLALLDRLQRSLTSLDLFGNDRHQVIQAWARQVLFDIEDTFSVTFPQHLTKEQSKSSLLQIVKELEIVKTRNEEYAELIVEKEKQIRHLEASLTAKKSAEASRKIPSISSQAVDTPTVICTPIPTPTPRSDQTDVIPSHISPNVPKSDIPAAPPMPPGKPVERTKAERASKPLKPLDWKKIDCDLLSNSVWSRLLHESDTLSFDKQELERLFFANRQHKRAPKVQNQAHSQFGKSFDEQASCQSALTRNPISMRRRLNILIMLRGLRMELDDLQTAILSIDGDAFGTDALEMISQYVPTSSNESNIDEVSWLHSDQNDPASFAETESFLYMLSLIPNVECRLKCMVFRRRITAEIAEIESDIDMVIDAVNQIKSSTSLRHILSLVLKIGNYMNGTSFRGNASAFSVESLLVLNSTTCSSLSNADREDSDTLLHYVCKELRKHGIEASNLHQEISLSGIVGNQIHLKTLGNSVTEVQAGMKLVQDELTRLQPLPKPEGDTFVHTFSVKCLIRSFTTNSRIGVLILCRAPNAWKQCWPPCGNSWAKMVKKGVERLKPSSSLCLNSPSCLWYFC